VKRELERIEIPFQHETQARTWPIVQSAFAEREPLPQERRAWRPVLVLAVAAVLAGAFASPPGRAVIDRVREVVGVESAKPALFSLPSSGRLLVDSDEGAWIVSSDGSKRLLRDWREASWSPFGRFVVAAKTNELAALEPNGDVRWTLARPNVRFPRWGGGRTDTRIAYLSGSALRVVAGDATVRFENVLYRAPDELVVEADVPPDRVLVALVGRKDAGALAAARSLGLARLVSTDSDFAGAPEHRTPRAFLAELGQRPRPGEE